ncbi:hypothetical protein [Paenibacillus sp. OV219]|uniref:hypothetical protein n=1 Tax=Paenibacillus sp. OV219 TaxID=1884377 RepID=UPI0011601685|nr:hypothetical protein [Paenibacillus sp. OV219]
MIKGTTPILGNVEIPGLMEAAYTLMGNKQDRFILDDGEIYNVKVARFIFFGYSFTKLHLHGREYEGYEVGRGREGHFLCIYEGDQQIALIEKDRVVMDNKDTYDLYVEASAHTDIAKIFAIHWDCSTYANSGEYLNKSKSIEIAFTINKFLKSKYDPAFKSRCF